MVLEAGDQSDQAFLVPAGITLLAEEDGALVVIKAVNFPAKGGKMEADFRADQAGGSSDEEFFHG